MPTQPLNWNVWLYRRVHNIIEVNIYGRQLTVQIKALESLYVNQNADGLSRQAWSVEDGPHKDGKVTFKRRNSTSKGRGRCQAKIPDSGNVDPLIFSVSKMAHFRCMLYEIPLD